MDARAEQGLRAADALETPHDVEREWYEGIVTAVRQLLLDLRPYELVGIELRRVTREAVDLQAWVPAQKRLNILATVDLPAIPQERDRGAQVPEQLPEEGNDFGTRDVAGVKVEVQPETLTVRGHSDGGDDGDLVTPVAMPKLRCLSDGRPRFADVRDQQEPAFVEEGEMCAPARGVFLSGAIRPASTALWPPRHAAAPGVPASANSTRGRGVGVPTRRPGCTARRTACGSPGRCA